ncbi:DUF222 domain-containing protein [Tsukamurella sp. NPDC003166]|uniref:HNH endonuclease signature motif containing protein n=1 Tax=Tsukamurella sp. NPDC003166 TaxID=3154444 RepID=UPI0033A0D5DB
MTGLYALQRVMYADDEAEYLATEGALAYSDMVAARRRLNAAESALKAQVMMLLRVGPAAAEHAIATAIGLVERTPRLLALVGENALSPKAAETALGRARVLTDPQARQFDETLAERLSRELEVLSLPALREAADLITKQLDPDAAEKRRRLAEQDRRITFRPEADGMGAVFAMLPAAEQQELRARVEHIATTVCDDDPRSVPQRQSDGFMQLLRGYSTLGCECESEGCRYQRACYAGEPDADGVITRFITMINVVLNERDLPTPAVPAVDTTAAAADAAEPTADAAAVDQAEEPEGEPARDTAAGRAAEGGGLGYLIGYGPITADHARELVARDDARIRPFGQRIPDEEISGEVIPGIEDADEGVSDSADFDGQDIPAEESNDLAAAADSDSNSNAGFGGGAARWGRPFPPGVIDIQWGREWKQIVRHLQTPDHSDPDDPGPDDSDPDDPGPDDSDPDDPGPHGPDSGGPRSGGPRSGGHDGPGPGDGGPSEGGPVDGTGGGPGRPDGLDPGPAGPLADRGPGRVDPPIDRVRPNLARAHGTRGYRPTADLRRYLRLIYPRCVFAYCNRPAARAQLDHGTEFDHHDPTAGGQTTADSMQPLCIEHHHVKTRGEWVDARLPDGRILWTAPDQRRYIVDPTSTVLALFPDLARIDWTRPESGDQGAGRGRGQDRDGSPQPGGLTRLQREHARRQQLREQYADAAAQDIALADAAKRAESTVEQRITAALGAPPAPPPRPSDDAPPPF